MRLLAAVFAANLWLLCAGDNKVEQAFKLNQIIGDVIDKAPLKEMEVEYIKTNKEVKLGNEIKPADVKEIPKVDYDGEKNCYYTLAMVDPDVPSRKNVDREEFQHWLVVNIPGDKVEKGETLSEYIGSGPLKDTGLHRYIFLVYKQPRKISFDEPYRNRTHGSTRNGFSIKKFAEKYHLREPVAGNFYQAQYDDSVPGLYKQISS